MKKIIAITFFTITSISAIHAQFGVNIGYQNAGIVHPDRLAFNGFLAGISHDLQVKDEWYILYGADYSFFGKTVTKRETPLLNSHTTYNYHFIDLPIHLAFVAQVLDDVKVFISAGPKLTFGIAANSHRILDGELISQPALDLYADKDFSRFNVKAGAAVGAQYKNYRLSFGYDWGALNLYSGILDNVKYSQSEFFVKIAYIFN